MVDLWEEFRGDSGFLFLSVSSSGMDREQVEFRDQTGEFMRQHVVGMPTYNDPEGANRQALAMLLGRPAIGFPTTVLLDRTGIIRAIWQGYSPGAEEQMQQLVSIYSLRNRQSDCAAHPAPPRCTAIVNESIVSRSSPAVAVSAAARAHGETDI